MATYLITSQEVKSNTSMGGNVDSDNIMHLIYDAQIMVLENILGTALYERIVTDFTRDNLSGIYARIFGIYIKPVLWHSTYAAYLREANVLAKNGGVFTNTPEEATATPLENIQYVAKNAQSKADVYIERLTRFLCDSDVPEYDNAQANDYDIDPKIDITTVSGWYLGRGYGKSTKTGAGTAYDEL